ncbi:hypothetical protein V8G54_023690 [Vigna mungo]|uniref:PB1-like domain-containing protein n=1 Tax=Vigna mungo TaxID=3915 RepID=A0AAQ3RSG0_VIGMU
MRRVHRDFGCRGWALECGRESRLRCMCPLSGWSGICWKHIQVVIHHGGIFVNEGCLKYEGETETMYFDPDIWSYFVVVSVVKSLGYDGFKELWLEALIDDVGAMQMVTLAHLNGRVHLYVVHIVSQPDVIHMIEYKVDEGGEEVAPLGEGIKEGGEGAQLAEGIEDGGVRANGERIKVVVGEVEEVDGEAERIEVEEVAGEAKRTTAYELQQERIEAEEVHGEDDRIATYEFQQERIEAKEVEAEQVHVEADKVKVLDGDIC